MTPNIEQLTIEELKSSLVAYAKETSDKMAPMLYHLREKLKAQGKAGHGFGRWVEANLGITRRTADRWANEWAIAQGLKKAPTIRQKSKSDEDVDIVPGVSKELFSLNLSLTPVEQEELVLAWVVLGEEQGTRLVYDTLTAAAKAQQPTHEAFTTDVGEMQQIVAVSPSGKELTYTI